MGIDDETGAHVPTPSKGARERLARASESARKLDEATRQSERHHRTGWDHARLGKHDLRKLRRKTADRLEELGELSNLDRAALLIMLASGDAPEDTPIPVVAGAILSGPVSKHVAQALARRDVSAMLARAAQEDDGTIVGRLAVYAKKRPRFREAIALLLGEVAAVAEADAEADTDALPEVDAVDADEEGLDPDDEDEAETA